MRVVQVSAHYPPDFVSGGTLVPQRIARGLVARGHDVRVFAGNIGSGQRLAVRDEVVDGVPVRWVGVSEFTDWRREDNFRHPAVATLFADYLAEVRPQVVHLHSLQALGGDLVTCAREAGARVVVTMHDFWWVCSRQFLVDTAERPCPLVVIAGSCACGSSHRDLLQRNAFLASQLRAADVVLTPSSAAARVLAANGIDPNRLRIDENGLPAPAHVVRQPLEHGSVEPVRFLFTGGADPLKGWPVLAAAVRDLPETGGWTLSAYGFEGGRPAVTSPLTNVDIRRPYRPDDAAEIFAAHDVLILPSLMRESFSIVTREALAAGLAVVCTDTLGPEEVVRDGENGLVVPAADIPTLTAALQRLVHEPALLQQLRRGTEGESFRTIEDQVDGSVALYAELVAASEPAVAPAPATGRNDRVRHVLFVAGIDGAPLRYRAHLAVEALALVDIKAQVLHYRDPRLTRLIAQVDAVVFYRVPATAQIIDLAARIRARTPAIPLLYDIDDLVFDTSMQHHVHGLADLPPAEVDLWWQGVRRYRTAMQECDAFVGSTHALCDHVENTVGLPAFRWANGVGVLLGQLSDLATRKRRTPGPLRIGYFSGTNMHDQDWATCEAAVVDVLRQRPDVDLWLGGPLVPSGALDPVAAQVHRLDLLPWQELPARIRDIDVNLAPLSPGSPFNEAKSAIKWLEAALVATPTVASPTQPFREAIDDGVTGLLAESRADWRRQIERLLDDVALRRTIGERARRAALLTWGPPAQGRRYRAILDAAADLVDDPGRARPLAPQQDKEFTDEPPASIRFAPYSAQIRRLRRGRPDRIAPAWRRYPTAVRRILRDEGTAGIVGRVVRSMRAGLRKVRDMLRLSGS